MIDILQKPDDLNFIGNLKNFIISSSSEVSFCLKKGDDVIINEVYAPDFEGAINIDIRDVVRPFLSTSLPDTDIFVQKEAVASFSAIINSEAFSFSVINAELEIDANTGSFCQANWLTGQPQNKKTIWNAPEFLSYYFTCDANVVVSLYPISELESPEKIIVYSGKKSQFVTFNMSMSHIFSKAAGEIKKYQGFFDAWVESDSGRLTFVQRYIYSEVQNNEHFFLSKNPYGGLDTFCFTGEQALVQEIEYGIGKIAGKKVSTGNKIQRKYRQIAGYQSISTAAWINSFFSAAQNWALYEEAFFEIAIDNSESSISDFTDIQNSSFEFILSVDNLFGFDKKSLERDLPMHTFPEISDVDFSKPDKSIPGMSIWRTIPIDSSPQVVIHNLGRRPSVSVIDNMGNEVVCDIKHIDENSFYLRWRGTDLKGNIYII